MKFLLFLIHLVTNLCAQYLLLNISLFADWLDLVPAGFFVFALCSLLLGLDFFSVRALSRSGRLRVLNPALAHFFDAVLATPSLAVALFYLFSYFQFGEDLFPASDLVYVVLVLLYEALFALARILLYRESAKSPLAEAVLA